MNFSRDLMRGTLDLMILSVLSDEPLYGYLIQKRIREVSANMVRMQAGTLYPLLHRLEQAGAITSRWDKTSGRERKWYELTEKGQRRLQNQAEQWYEYSNCIRRLLKPVMEAISPGSTPEIKPT
ncbi:MAG: PadR family transcriptional regulator [Planctomycetota bacterium]|jgi:transcriptional regulator